MAKEVIRQDVIEFSLVSNGMIESLKKINDEIDDLKKKLGILEDENPFKNTEKQADEAKESIEETQKESKKLKETLDDVGKTSFNKVISGLKKVGTVAAKATIAAAKVTVAGVGTASAGVAAMVGSSVKAYGEYQQLVGGVETLFGAGGANSVQEYAKSVGKSVSEVQDKFKILKESEAQVFKDANDAYKTAGLSANDYMETVTGFSASLISSLNGDTKKAAEYSNKAIVDMSDNANKMGSDMESIQNAYQGFAKQNYTMLDNLKLGYGGTQEEMKRLINDAAKMDKVVKANDTSFSNIVLAIHAVQENMAISGTTAKEASTTIQGSFSSLKSSWGNLMTSLVVGGDSFDQCLVNLVDSAKTFGDNVMPAIRKGLEGVGRLITELTPYIEAELPGLIDELLPPLLNAATALVKGLIKSLPNIAKTVIKELPDIVKQIGQAITEAFGTQMPSLGKFGEGFIKNTDIIAKIIPLMLGGIVAFKAIKPIVSGLGKVSSLFGKSDKSIEKMQNPLGNIAKADIKTILKGMANIAIIVGGFTVLAGAVMLVAPYIAQLADMKSIIKVVGTIAVLGAVGTVLAGAASVVGKIPVKTVTKGLANIAIMIGGLTAVAAAFTFVTPYIAQFADMSAINKVIEIIAKLGIVGTTMSGFAGLVGLIPVSVVVTGLANIALIIGGLTAVIGAFGMLSKIDGFNSFISSGGEILSNLFLQIGKIAGSLAGGLGEGLTASLPAIGTNLTNFVNAIKPMFSMFGGSIDLKSIGDFFVSIGNFMLTMAGEGIVSIFTGGVDFAKLGQDLNTFAENSRGFFEAVKTFPKEGFKKAKLMFEALGAISNVPNSGGIAQWFSGENDYSALADGLGDLSNASVVNFFKTASEIPQEGLEGAKSMFEVIGEISSIPNTGGIAQIFSGENDISGMAANLPVLGSAVAELYTSISGISDFGRISTLFTELKSASGIEAITTMVIDNINTIVTKVGELPNLMGKALESSGESLSTAMAKIWKDAVTASVTPVNKLLDGANWILNQFGSSTRIAKWTPYARGTDGHKGGNALVNDGRGAELVQMPNGNTFIPSGRNVLIPNAPRGMQVLSAEDTANVMGRHTPTFRYANGTSGNALVNDGRGAELVQSTDNGIDIWNYIDNASGLVETVKNSYVNYDGLKGAVLSIGKGLVSTVSNSMTSWVKKLYDEFGALSLANYNASAGVEQWRSTVIRALQMTGQYSEANVTRTLYQMYTESGGNPSAINTWDSNAKKGTPSKGLMQVIDPTFKAYAMPGYDKNIYDPLSNILASIRYAVSRYGSLARAYQGHGYANGGIATQPSIFGENGAEMAIPLTSNKRDRALKLWLNTGELLGLSQYTPENSPTLKKDTLTGDIYNNFNLNINVEGGDSNRQTARSVKNAAKEALREFMNDFANTNKAVREY